MECTKVDDFAELSFDGELGAAEQAALEAHLGRCPACRRRIQARSWLQSQVRAHLRASSEDPTPIGLRTRVATRIRDEERRRTSPFRRALPVTFGLAALATLSWSTNGNTTTLDPEASVERHAAYLPPEVRALGDSREVERFLRTNFGHPIEIPDPSRSPTHLRLVGARLDHVADRRAAVLMYDHRGARVSMLVYPTDRAELAPPPQFEAQVVAGRPVLVGQHRGYNVMAWIRGPLVYSVVADIDPYELSRLVGSF